MAGAGYILYPAPGYRIALSCVLPSVDYSPMESAFAVREIVALANSGSSESWRP